MISIFLKVTIYRKSVRFKNVFISDYREKIHVIANIIYMLIFVNKIFYIY